MKNGFLLLVLSLFIFEKATSQERFKFENPSFEDAASAGKVPSGWLNMGAPEETPPDVQPGQFGVTMSPQHGWTYLGLVVRDNNTWEGVGQVFDKYLQKDSTYAFSAWLARSNIYVSISKTTGQEANYTSPTILKIWGVNTETGQEELLAESAPVSLSKWILYTFTLKPTVADFNEIDLMVYYAPGYEQQNGNLLIDNCSEIVKAPK